MTGKLEQQIKLIAQHNGLILLYHFIARETPDALLKTLHNVPPTTLQTHIKALSRFFKFVSLREFSRAKSKRGLAAITFDDGYRNVIKNALPVLEYFGYPATLFLNPITFSKRCSWRDKIRYLIHHQLEQEFASEFSFHNKSGRFYRYSKHPQNNSALLDQALDNFLNNFLHNFPQRRRNNLGGDLGDDLGDSICSDLYGNSPYAQIPNLPTHHPLMSYGNHSQNHYVLSSLTDSQQAQEIERAHQCLQDIPNLTLSECFSAPFGGDQDINSATYELVKAMDYQSLLMSRQRIQPGQSATNKIQVLERFVPRSDDIIGELTQAYHM
ncbi:polysaccharide deacetylase family protein [Candidatus Spongiihabitans sp.]|uniref:polysaccharide deacetylase family protein n=1 Tax=Candidatus Spongiihabitans sp. TaxID=3101308 RepID=UPI003C7A35A7